MPGRSKDRGRLLVLMAKQPTPDRTKTRLVPPLSPESAAALYRCFLIDKLGQMRHVERARWAVAYAPTSARGVFAALAPGFGLIEQTGPDLAARLRNVFSWAFEAGYGQVAAIDGDTPTLPPVYLRAIFAALDDPGVDVALGPTEDGGYYGIGMKRPHPYLFDVAMSTPHVTRDTLARADGAGLCARLLPSWYDVDRPEDLDRLAAELIDGAGAGFRPTITGRFLARLEARSSP